MTEREISFGLRRVGIGHPVIVVAEIGVNHEGSAETCARMIEAAALAGADSIKLQTIDADANYVRDTESHRLFSRCALTREETAGLFRLTRERGMEPFTTAGDIGTLDWVERLEPAAHKISSGLLTTHPVVAWAARTGRSVIMSTGLATADEIDGAVEVARQAGASGIALLQCTSIYPAPIETLNLSTIGWLAERYGVVAGYSDHSLGIETPPLAVAAGAKIIEKHFTFDLERAGFDHAISLDPKGFSTMIRGIRRAEVMMGEATKRLTEAEAARAPLFHRVLVALKPIAKGEAFDARNLGYKRPLPGRLGLEPRHFNTIVGRRAARELMPDDPVDHAAVENWP
jgi:sialic acid synthase SpsE